MTLAEQTTTASEDTPKEVSFKDDAPVLKETTDGTYAASNNGSSSRQESPLPQYPGDVIDEQGPPEGKYQKFDFPNPFLLVAFYDAGIAEGSVTLHPWQHEINVDLGEARDKSTGIGRKATSQNPYKYCALANNGSGKDKFIIAPFAVWFTLTKIRARVIITTASGTQLSSQTEPYIKDLCDKVNALHGQEVYRIRQRYIKCLLTGSEIRMFATDEAGKAEGYHPIDADSEMAIVVNEGKSVSEDIHRALRRCTGFNYWLEVSSAGEPKGFLYEACTNEGLGFEQRRVTSYECPHINEAEIKEDIILDGEESAFFRSKHLSLFTSIGGQTVISMDLVNHCLKYPPKFEFLNWPRRVGIDLAAGGDENVICITQGNKCLKEIYFRETDTTITAQRLNKILKDENIDKKYQHIYADDGGVGRAIIDMLVSMGWSVNRVMNQWAAVGNKKQFGNRGAENWWRIARIIEDKFFDLTTLSTLTHKQLYNRHFKQSLTGGRIFLEDKKEAKAHGRPSPDRADAFILSLTGLTVEDYIKDSPNKVAKKEKPDMRPKTRLTTREEVLEHYDNEETYGKYADKKNGLKHRLFNSLRTAMRN